MNTQIIESSKTESISLAESAINGGEVIVMPTDTVYGIGADAFNEKAVEKIYIIKNRPEEKSIPILIGQNADLEKVAIKINDLALKLASKFWPGPLTIVLYKNKHIPNAVSDKETIAIRIPNNNFVRQLALKCGPLAVTSANISGKPPAKNAEEAGGYFQGKIPLIVDGGQVTYAVPSTIVDCTLDYPKILREGPISLEQILDVYKS